MIKAADKEKQMMGAGFEPWCLMGFNALSYTACTQFCAELQVSPTTVGAHFQYNHMVPCRLVECTDLSPIPALKWTLSASFDSSWYISSSLNLHHYFFWRFSLESISVLPCFSSWANHCGHLGLFKHYYPSCPYWLKRFEWLAAETLSAYPIPSSSRTDHSESQSYQVNQFSILQKEHLPLETEKNRRTNIYAMCQKCSGQ